jgi:hypothetical protein
MSHETEGSPMRSTFQPTRMPEPIALRPKDAARALGIGQRKLWDLTYPRGPIRCVRAGTCCLYPVTALRAWLDEQAAVKDP